MDGERRDDASGAGDGDRGGRRIAAVAVLVRDYDEAIRYYTTVLRFALLEDTDLGGGKRWVLVAPSSPAARDGQAGGTALLLARAATPEQEAHVGNQAGGRVFLFLHVEDFAAEHAALTAAGVTFTEGPRQAPWGTVGVFVDLYGNRWDLIGRR